MKFLLTTCGALGGAVALTSCLTVKEPICQNTSYVPIVSVAGPKTVAVNQPAVFTIDYVLDNTCGSFSNVVVVPLGNTREVAVSQFSNGCSCSTSTAVSQTKYQFQFATAGKYYFRFLSSNTTAVLDSIVVN